MLIADCSLQCIVLVVSLQYHFLYFVIIMAKDVKREIFCWVFQSLFRDNAFILFLSLSQENISNGKYLVFPNLFCDNIFCHFTWKYVKQKIFCWGFQIVISSFSIVNHPIKRVCKFRIPQDHCKDEWRVNTFKAIYSNGEVPNTTRMFHFIIISSTRGNLFWEKCHLRWM